MKMERGGMIVSEVGLDSESLSLTTQKVASNIYDFQ